MKITADTNVLVRAIVGDDAIQSAAARRELEAADAVALPLAALCELAWVLGRDYKLNVAHIAQAIERLLESESVLVNRAAAQAGLDQLRAGGDFADGVIAHEGAWLGADTFVSFDLAAVRLMTARGEKARQPAPA
ncbi:MAG: type II toxin-antitoxin system VapC family toxin [Pseudomonadota bacterium]|nr:type II toxin-antitoxin system VapC family toxin [Pseudomonadota bacterium]